MDFARRKKVRLLTIAAAAAAVLTFIAVGLALDAPQRNPLQGGLPPGEGGLLGTDPYGRPILKLLGVAAAESMIDAALATAATLAIAIPLGLIAGIRPGSWVDRIQIALAKLLDSLGLLILGLCIAAAMPGLGQRSFSVLLAFVAWPLPANVLRGLVSSQLQSGHVEAARAMGVGPTRILVVHVLPATWDRLLPVILSLAATFVAVIGALQFLGAGSTGGLSLGYLLFDAQNYLRSAPYYFIGTTVTFLAIILLPIGAASLYRRFS